MLNIRWVFKTTARLKQKVGKTGGARKTFKGRKQGAAATWRAAGVRPVRLRKQDWRRQRGQRQRRPGAEEGAQKEGRNGSSHTVTERPANTDARGWHSDAHTDWGPRQGRAAPVRAAAPWGCEEVGARPGGPGGAESSLWLLSPRLWKLGLSISSPCHKCHLFLLLYLLTTFLQLPLLRIKDKAELHGPLALGVSAARSALASAQATSWELSHFLHEHRISAQSLDHRPAGQDNIPTDSGS